jgi:hypothetical protein
MIETLKSELADLEARRVALRNAHGVRAAATASARDSLIGGNDDFDAAIHTVTETRSASEALLYAVNEIDGRIAQKRIELADAEREQNRIATFEHRLSIIRRGSELLKTYLDVRAEVNEELKRHATEMSAAFFALQDNRRAWLNSIPVDDATFGFDEFIDAGADPTACRAQWDGTKRAASDIPYIMSHVQPFEDVLRVIFHVWNEATFEESSRAA